MPFNCEIQASARHGPRHISEFAFIGKPILRLRSGARTAAFSSGTAFSSGSPATRDANPPSLSLTLIPGGTKCNTIFGESGPKQLRQLCIMCAPWGLAICDVRLHSGIAHGPHTPPIHTSSAASVLFRNCIKHSCDRRQRPA